MRHLLIACTIAALAATPALAVNENTTIVLHAVDTSFAPCEAIGALDCESVLPTLDISGMTTPVVFMLLNNYDNVAGVQAAFDVSPTWSFLFGLWNCQGFAAVGFEPTPPWGPFSGSIVVAFDVITGGELAAIGRMHFVGAIDGCMDIIESTFPFGTHVVSGGGESTPIIPENRVARVCVGPGGVDGCEPGGSTPVASTTWGSIKAQYRR